MIRANVSPVLVPANAENWWTAFGFVSFIFLGFGIPLRLGGFLGLLLLLFLLRRVGKA